MKILLIHPTLMYPEPIPRPLKDSMIPLVGANRLAAYLRIRGHEALVLDPLYFDLVRQPGERFEDVATRLAGSWVPDLIGVTVLSHLRHNAEAVVRRLKRDHKAIPVVVGGPHVTDGPILAVRQFAGVADLILAGAGEVPLALLADGGATPETVQELPGLLWARDDLAGKCVSHMRALPPKPCDWPVPDYDQYLEYMSSLERVIVVTTHGCPNACVFCSVARTSRMRLVLDSETTLQWLEMLRSRYGVREISCHDETFFADGQRALAILDGMRTRGLIFDDIYLHTTIASLDREMLRAFRRAGGRHLFVGLESGSQRIRLEMGKPGRKELSNVEILRRTDMCRDEGIDLGVFLIVGWPSETEADARDTETLVEAIAPADVQTSVLKIYPGTALYRRALREGRIHDKDWLDPERSFFTYVTGEDLAAAQQRACRLEKRFQTHRIRKPFESQGDRYMQPACSVCLSSDQAVSL